MQMLQSLLSWAASQLEDGLANTVNQCFIVSADSLLSRWEIFLGLDVDTSKSLEYRRERIAAKLSGIGTTTKAMITDTASRYSNGEVEVIEDNPHSKFTVRFVGTIGIPANMEDLKKTIEEIKPAHLAVIYEFMYNTWSGVCSVSWEQAAQYTWEDIRTVNFE